MVIDAIHDDAGALIGYAKITRDCTERRERELQVLHAKELAERYNSELTSLSSFLEAVVSHIPSCVLVLDAVSVSYTHLDVYKRQSHGSCRASSTCRSRAWHSGSASRSFRKQMTTDSCTGRLSLIHI